MGYLKSLAHDVLWPGGKSFKPKWNLMRPIVFWFTAMFGLVVMNQRYTDCADTEFLYNRASQMLACLGGGSVPWYYFADFEGAGYGTPFFYGQLVLYPFLWLVPLGIRTFTRAWLAVMLAVLYAGASRLAGMFWEDGSQFVGLMVAYGSYVWQLVLVGSLYANLMGVGICMLFLSAFVGWARDGRGGVGVACWFFVLLNAHLLTAVVCVAACCAGAVRWRIWRRRGWWRLPMLAGCVCMYNVANMLWHMWGMGFSVSTPGVAGMSSPLYVGENVAGGLLAQMVLSGMGHTVGNTVMDLPALVLSMWLMVRRFRSGSVRTWETAVWAACWLLMLAGVAQVFQLLCVPLLQYPARYMPFVLVGYFTVSFRHSPLWARRLCLVSAWLFVLLGGLVFAPVEEHDDGRYHSTQVMGGEYLSDCFVYEYSGFREVLDAPGFWEDGKGGLYYHADGSDGEVLFPRLWYRGMRCHGVADGAELPVRMGWSQFCSVDLTGYEGDVVLRYIHPWWLQALGVLCYGLFLYKCVRRA